MISLTTASSAAALSTNTRDAAEKFGIDKKLVDFGIPIGQVLFKPGAMIELFGLEFEVCEQGLALLSLVPIWLYRARQGHHSKAFQYACYAFYPVHMLILGLIQLSL